MTLSYDTERRARAIARSLRPELDDLADDRSTTRLERAGRDLELAIDAADLVALRAATNTWLGLVQVAERVAETGDF